VEAVEPNPASDLLVLAGGGLVPLRFVVAHEPGVSVTVDVPEGLLETGDDAGSDAGGDEAGGDQPEPEG
jgi:hypothetical protein